MAENKSKWIADATSEIVDFLGLPHRGKRDADIEAIIDRHRPPGDKVAGKLAMACNKMAGFLVGWEDCLSGKQMTAEDFDRDSGVKEARVALAEHEKEKRSG